MVRNYWLAVVALSVMLVGNVGVMTAQPAGEVVRIAEIEVNPVKLGAYISAVKEEMAKSIRVEPGVLAIYSVAIKDKPNHLRFFEIYANEAAYHAHIASPQFKKYVATTQSMILSRKLIETVPIQLSKKTQ